MLHRLVRGITGVLTLATALIPLSATPASVTAQAPDSALLAGLEWRSIGPTNMAGRVTDVEGVPGTATFYVASAAGGIWKTINNGTTFTAQFQNERVVAMGDLAIAPSDPSVIYAGTGEEDSRNSISPGGGVYISRDAGETWTLTGLEGTQAIGRILVHPRDPNTAWVAAVGKIWANDDQRGLYKTTNGGESWRRVKHMGEKAGFIDLAMDPRDPDVLWAASWERVRGPWYLNSGGPGSGLWKSTDGGERWTEVEGGGFPSTLKGRIGLAIAPSDPDVMYALVEAEAGEEVDALEEDEAATSGLKGTGLYRSEDGGRSWRWMNDKNTRPFYYSQVRVAPDDPELVFWSSTPVQFSKDGGKTVGEATVGIHVDHHAMWWDPTDPDHFIVGNDGGIAVTWDRGGTYDFINSFPLGQFYHVSYNMEVPYRVCGGLQDNGTWCGPSRRARGGIDHHMWYTINGGDGFYSQQDPTDPDIVYAESQGGSMARMNLRTGERESLELPDWKERTKELRDSIAVYEGVTEPRELTADEARKVAAWRERVEADSARYDLRYNWSAPLIMSPHDPRTLYAAGNRVLVSRDGGRSFDVISEDLSTADTMKIRVSTRETGGITPDVTGAETHSTIVAVAESPLVEGRLFAGTDDGNVWFRRGPDAEWEQVRHRSFRGLPANSWVSRVEPSRHHPDRFYVSFDGHRTNDFEPYIYVTDDLRRFRRITNGLPTGAPDCVHVVREDPVNPELLFAGTDVGAYVSFDRGESWDRFMNGLPTVPVHDLKIHPRDRELIAATHGRSIWIVDIAPLQQLGATRVAGEPVVFDPTPALQYGDVPSGGESTGHQYFSGDSRPYGGEIVYYIPEGWKPPAAADTGDAAGEAAAGQERPEGAPLGQPVEAADRPAQAAGRAGGRGRPGGAGGAGFGRDRGPQAAIAIVDAAGDTVAELNGPARPGLQRVQWNLRREGEAEAKSPSEIRDSIRSAEVMQEVADSLVTHEGVDRALADRAVAMMKSGNLRSIWGGGGGGRGGRARPGERYPEETPADTVSAAGAEAPAGEAAPAAAPPASPAAPDMEALRNVVRDIFYGLRARNAAPSFRGFGGDASPVAPGSYTVHVTIGDRTWTKPLTVVRAADFTPDEAEARLELQEFFESEGER